MKRIAVIIAGITLALSLIGSAAAANWNSKPEPTKPAAAKVNWSS